MQASRFAPDGWRRASCIGDGSWSTLSPTWAWTCTKIRSRSRLQRRAGGVGYPRSPACASGGGARPASGPSAIERILAAPRPSLQPASLDTDPSTLAGRTEVRASGASHRAGGLYRGRRGGDGTARSSGSTHQGGATGVVTRAGGARVAGAARHGTGGGSDPGGGTRRYHPLRQSTPAYGVSRPGAVRALQRGHAASGQDHQGWERRGTSHADRGRVELPVPGTDQPRASVATGGSGALDSRHGVEGAGTTVSAISQARPGEKAADSGHYRNRA